MQARDDGFVSFSDGKTMFSELLYLAEGTQHVLSHPSHSAEFVEIAGGHLTGFLRCRSLLPGAVLASLDTLRKKTAAVAA